VGPFDLRLQLCAPQRHACHSLAAKSRPPNWSTSCPEEPQRPPLRLPPTREGRPIWRWPLTGALIRGPAGKIPQKQLIPAFAEGTRHQASSSRPSTGSIFSSVSPPDCYRETLCVSFYPLGEKILSQTGAPKRKIDDSAQCFFRFASAKRALPIGRLWRPPVLRLACAHLLTVSNSPARSLANLVSPTWSRQLGLATRRKQRVHTFGPRATGRLHTEGGSV